MDSNFDNKEQKEFFENKILCIDQLLDMIQKSFSELLPLGHLSHDNFNEILEQMENVRQMKKDIKLKVL